MRIAILCNDKLGFPAIHQLLPHRLIVAVGTTDRVPETRMVLQQLCKQGNVHLQVFARKDFESTLLSWLALHQPDVVLVKTFPYKIPSSALTIPKFGFINFHYAPLPEFRGSNPLFWMIRNGIGKGGVAIHQMDESFDTGAVLLQQPVEFLPGTTFGMAVSQLSFMGATLTGNLLQGLLSNSLQPMKQDLSKAKWYGRPTAVNLTVQWNDMNATEICNLVNACNPWNKGAIVRFRGWTFAISNASISKVSVPKGTLPGIILIMDEKDGLVISTKDEQTLRANVIYTEEGFFPGQQLASFGIQIGEKLDS